VKNRDISSSTQMKRDINGMARLLIVMVLLVLSILGAQHLLGFSSGLAIVVGGVFAYAISTIIARRLLPRPSMLTDEERVRLTPNMRRWLVAGVFALIVIHFGGDLRWVPTVALVTVSISCFVVGELYLRRRAQRRLSSTDV
jgi:uncharacterized oligopeptide transporter (OPT) family protein